MSRKCSLFAWRRQQMVKTWLDSSLITLLKLQRHQLAKQCIADQKVTRSHVAYYSIMSQSNNSVQKRKKGWWKVRVIVPEAKASLLFISQCHDPICHTWLRLFTQIGTRQIVQRRSFAEWNEIIHWSLNFIFGFIRSQSTGRVTLE